MLRGPDAFEIAGAVGEGWIVDAPAFGQAAIDPVPGVETTSAFANTGAIGASCDVGASTFGFETANLAFATMTRDDEMTEAR
jgi:hypothetical protein